MNNKAIRVPSYATYHATNGTLKIVVELEAKIADRATCEKDASLCSEHVLIHLAINMKVFRLLMKSNNITGLPKMGSCRELYPTVASQDPTVTIPWFSSYSAP